MDHPQPGPSRIPAQQHPLPLPTPTPSPHPTSPPSGSFPLSSVPQHLLLLTLGSTYLTAARDLPRGPDSAPRYQQLVYASVLAHRAALGVKGLTEREQCECRVRLAEVLVRWTKGSSEAEKVISDGIVIAQKHDNLQPYLYRLYTLHIKLYHEQGKAKFTRSMLKRALDETKRKNRPDWTYHFLFLQSALCPPGPAALSPLRELDALATKRGDVRVGQIAALEAARVLCVSGEWEDAHRTLEELERRLDYVPTPEPRKDGMEVDLPKGAPVPSVSRPLDVAEKHALLQLLMLGSLHAVRRGDADAAKVRLRDVHTLVDELDGNAEEEPPPSILLPIHAPAPSALHSTPPPSRTSRALSTASPRPSPSPLPTPTPITLSPRHPAPPHALQLSPPARTPTFALGFLLSCRVHRDPTGAKPRMTLFAAKGEEITRDLLKKEHLGEERGTWEDAWGDRKRIAGIRAGLLVPLVEAAIMRSELDEAEKHLNDLTALTRTYHLVPALSPLLLLLSAFLAHARGDPSTALQSYTAAAFLAGESSELQLIARLLRALLRVGLGEKDDAEVRTLVEDIGRRAESAPSSVSAAVRALGKFLEAITAEEIVKSKQLYSQALTTSSKAHDNHVRALLLACLSASFVHTHEEQARRMLDTGYLLARRMQPGADVDGGNVALSLWFGERSQELFRRQGEEKLAGKQGTVNERHREKLRGLAERVDAAAVAGGSAQTS